jgi:ParB family chromosome partitioning protein
MSAKQDNAKKRTGLGRGLGALLEDSDGGLQSRHPSDFAGSLEGVNLMDEISLELIDTNPFQPREFFAPEALQELAESIRVQGIIQPITVRKVSAKKYQLISGERRFQASQD